MPEDFVYNKAVTAVAADFLDGQIPKIPRELYDRFEIFKSQRIFDCMELVFHSTIDFIII